MNKYHKEKQIQEFLYLICDVSFSHNDIEISSVAAVSCPKLGGGMGQMFSGDVIALFVTITVAKSSGIFYYIHSQNYF